MNTEKTSFERNENVIIAESAPVKFRPGQLAWVISQRVIEASSRGNAVEYPINTTLYLIEYMDGSDAEIPADYLRHR